MFMNDCKNFLNIHEIFFIITLPLWIYKNTKVHCKVEKSWELEAEKSGFNASYLTTFSAVDMFRKIVFISFYITVFSFAK